MEFIQKDWLEGEGGGGGNALTDALNNLTGTEVVEFLKRMNSSKAGGDSSGSEKYEMKAVYNKRRKITEVKKVKKITEEIKPAS